MSVFKELFSRVYPNCSTIIPLKNRVALIYKKAIICPCCNQKLITTISWALLMTIMMTLSDFFLVDLLLTWLNITSDLALWGVGLSFTYCLIRLVEPLGSLIAFDINDDEI